MLFGALKNTRSASSQMASVAGARLRQALSRGGSIFWKPAVVAFEPRRQSFNSRDRASYGAEIATSPVTIHLRENATEFT